MTWYVTMTLIDHDTLTVMVCSSPLCYYISRYSVQTLKNSGSGIIE